MDDDDIIELEVTEEEEDVVPASPWTNNDTAAAVFAFAAGFATTTAEFFAQMRTLALGQAGREWQQIDRVDFVQDANLFISKLTEEGGADV